MNSLTQHEPTLGIKQLWLPVLFASIITATLLGQVWIHQHSITLAYQIHDLKSENNDLLTRKAEMEIELAALKTPKKLITAAEVIHNQYAPKSKQVITIRE